MLARMPVISLPLRLRSRRRFRRGLPRCDRDDLSAGARDRPHPWRAAARRPCWRVDPAGSARLSAARGASGRGGPRRRRPAPGRCDAAAPMTACSSGPTTGCCRWPPRVPVASSRRSRSSTLLFASSRSRPRSTAGTSSPRSQHGLPTAPCSRKRGSRVIPTSSSGSSCRGRTLRTARSSPTRVHRPVRERPAGHRPRGPRKLGAEAGQRVRAGDRIGRAHRAQFVRTFADVGPDQLLIYEDAHRTLAIAVSQGNAAQRLGLAVDDELRIRPHELAPSARLPASALAPDGLDQRPCAGACSPRRATRDARDRRRADRRPRAPGQDLDRACRAARLLCSLMIRDPPRLLPLAAGAAVAELVGPEAQDQVAQRRPA